MANSTPNLTVPHIATNQSQKEATANTAFDLLDEAMNSGTSIDVGGSANVTPSVSTMLTNFSFTLTGAITASIALIVPANKKFYRFHHNAIHPSIGDYTITVKVSGQTGVVLYPGDRRLLYCNGTDIVEAENTLTAFEKLVIDARTTTSEVINDSDRAALVTFSNASAVAATLTQAGTSGNFPAGWWCYVFNKGAGMVTVTPTTSTINGKTSHVFQQYSGGIIWSDGTNYFFMPMKRRPNLYTVATLPASPDEGDIAYATDGLKNGDNPSLTGTGVPVYYSANGPFGAGWYRYSDDTIVTN